jgi:nucleotide-binding universal stress UspA family protein
MIKKILVPLDGSRLAECALPYAEELAQALGSEVAFVSVTNRSQGFWPFEESKEREQHVLTPGDRPGPHLVPVSVCSMEEQAAQYLDTAAKGMEGKGIKVTKEVICGKTAEEIIIYANINNCDLIMMSSHGRGGPGKLIRGSVAQKILKSARIPVMIIRAPG